VAGVRVLRPSVSGESAERPRAAAACQLPSSAAACAPARVAPPAAPPAAPSAASGAARRRPLAGVRMAVGEAAAQAFAT
jgi:hypothetical protein